jgi:hypothetical protein
MLRLRFRLGKMIANVRYMKRNGINAATYIETQQ